MATTLYVIEISLQPPLLNFMQMNQSQFHELLLKIKECRDSAERQQIEGVYLQMRDVSPSDSFMQLMMNEIVTESPVQEYAIVLMNQDLSKNDNKSMIYRLSNKAFGQQIMVQLLQYIAEKPNDQICKLVASYFHYQMLDGIVFEELSQFVLQGSQQANTEVKQVCANILQLMCETSYTNIVKLNINALEIAFSFLNDPDDKVALNGLIALGNIIVNNDDDSGNTILPQATVSTMFDSMLNRVAQMIQQTTNYKVIQKMMQSIVSMIDIQPEQLDQSVSNIVAFLNELFKSKINDDITKEGVNLYSCIISNCHNAKRKLLQQLQSILADYIIPGAVFPEETIKEWLESPKDYEYETDSLFDACSNCIQVASFNLGKQVVLPVISSLCQQAMQNDDWHLWVATMISMEAAGEGMADVCNQKDAEMFNKLILKALQHQHPRVRYNALCTLCKLSESLKPKMQKYHREVIPAVNALMNDPCNKVLVHSSTAIVHYIEFLEYDQVYEHLNTFFGMIRQSWSGNLWMQTNALVILGSLCQIVDPEDITSFLAEICPAVFQQFELVMNAIQTQKNFEYEQTLYIKGLLEMISEACKCVPEMFRQYIEQIMANITIICQRGLQTSETEILDSAMDALNALTVDFSEQQGKYINILYNDLIGILDLEIVSYGQTLETEAQEHFKDDTVELQSNVLLFLSDFMKYNQICFADKFEHLYNKLLKFNPYGDQQCVHLLACLAELLNVAMVTQTPEIAYQCGETILKKMVSNLAIGEIVQKEEDKQFSFRITSMETISSADDVFADYIKYFIQFCIKINQQQYLQQNSLIFVKILQEHVDKTIHMLNEELKEIKNYEEGAEEQDSAIDEIFENFQMAFESIGMCLSNFVKGYGAQITPEILSVLIQFAIQLLQTGVSTNAAIIQTIEGVSLFADFAMHLPKELVEQAFTPEICNKLVEYAKQRQDHYQLVRNIFYTLYEFIKKTDNYSIASSAELLTISIQLLELFKKDGSEDALGAYDNVCSFLQQSGRICNQPAEYWQSLISYCNYMEVDDNEVENTLNFFVDQLLSNQLFQQSKQLIQDTNKLIALLYFGKFYSDLQKSDTMNSSVNQYVQQNQKILAQYISIGNSFVKKNYQNYQNALQK